MKCVVTKSVLGTFLEALLPVATECRALIDDSGITVKAVCAANVSLVNAVLPSEAFVSMTETGAAELIGIEIAKILTAVNMADSAEDEISIEKTVDDPYLHLTAPGLKYSWRTIDPTTVRKDPNPPDIVLPTVVTVDGTEFKRAVDKVAKVAEKVRFVTDDADNFYLDAEGSDNLIRLSLDATVMGPIASSMFGLDYIALMAKVFGKADGPVTLRLGTDHPVIITFSREGGDYEYMLAPRIEAE